MKICDFVASELNYIRSNANFTKDEAELFELRANDLSLEECAELMNVSVSTVNRLNKKLKIKVGKINEMCKGRFTRNT